MSLIRTDSDRKVNKMWFRCSAVFTRLETLTPPQVRGSRQDRGESSRAARTRALGGRTPPLSVTPLRSSDMPRRSYEESARLVHLVVKDAAHIEPDGLRVTTPTAG